MRQFPAVEAFRGNSNLIRVVGHRGARGILPENTLIGFEFAVSSGASLIEFDVVMSSDNVPVITHNHRLHAPTFRDQDGAFIIHEPKVSDLTWEDIQTFDVGRIDGRSEYGRRFPDQAQIDGLKVPSLSQLLTILGEKKYSEAHLMLEIKSDPYALHDEQKRRSTLSTILNEVRKAAFEQRTLIHSFDWRMLATCRKLAPEIPISFLTQLPEQTDDIGEDSSKLVNPDFSGRENLIPNLVAESGGSLWCPYFRDVTAEAAKLAHEQGLVTAVWTVNEPADIKQMVELGVDAIISDYPGRVQRYLADQGYSWD